MNHAKWMLVVWPVIGVWGCNALPQPAASQPFSRIIVFGDSLSDTGNVHLETLVIPQPPYACGRMSNGELWIEGFARHFGLCAIPSYLGGDNYAQIGAESGDGFFGQDGIPVAPNVLAQLDLYQERPDGTELFVVWAGANDVFDAATIDAAAVGGQIADNVAGAVQKLYERGGRSFLVLNLPDIGRTPSYRGSALESYATRACSIANAGVSARLNALAALPDISIYRLDVATLFDTLIADPPRQPRDETARTRCSRNTVPSNE